MGTSTREVCLAVPDGIDAGAAGRSERACVSRLWPDEGGCGRARVCNALGLVGVGCGCGQLLSWCSPGGVVQGAAWLRFVLGAFHDALRRALVCARSGAVDQAMSGANLRGNTKAARSVNHRSSHRGCLSVRGRVVGMHAVDRAGLWAARGECTCVGAALLATCPALVCARAHSSGLLDLPTN